MGTFPSFMYFLPPPWIQDRSHWWLHGLWALLVAMAEAGIGLWLKQVAGSVEIGPWLAGLGLLLALRVVLSWKRDLERERLALDAGIRFHRRVWTEPPGRATDSAWLVREGREWIESGSRAALEARSALLTLLLSIPLLLWIAPWISLGAIVAIAVVGRWARRKSKELARLAQLDAAASRVFALGEDWAWRSMPEASPAGFRPLSGRFRRSAFRSFATDRMARIREQLGWGAGGEALAHIAGWCLGTAALLSWKAGTLSSGSLLAFLGICLLAYRPVREAGRQLPFLRRAEEAWRSLPAAGPAPRSTRSPALSVRNLSVSFPGGVVPLQGLDFQLHPGDVAVAHGPNGSGKSTLLQILAGTPLDSEGRIHLPRRIFWMAQEPVLPPLPPDVWIGSRESVRDLLETLFPDGLPPSLSWDAPVPDGGHRLSRGERARLCLIAATTRPRGLWLLDEPISALPLQDGERILSTVLARRGKAAVILAQPGIPTFLKESFPLWSPSGSGRGPRLSRVEVPA